MPGPRNAVPEERLALSKDDLKMNGMPSARGDFLQLCRRCPCASCSRLDHAGAGDQEERLVEADFEAAELHAASPAALRVGGRCGAAAWCSRAARMKPVNSGWPSRGVDVNSGWNWHADEPRMLLRGSSMISTAGRRSACARERPGPPASSCGR